MKKLIALLCFLPGLAWGQAAVQQAGPVDNNTSVMWARDHQVRQAAGSAGDVEGKMIEGGTSAVGQVCSFSDTTSAVSYNTMCLDGAAGAIKVNGVSYPPTVGSGNVSGPSPTTVNAVSLWNSTTGTALANSALNGYASALTIPSGTLAQNVPGFMTTGGIGFSRTPTSATDGNNVLITRDANFTGGSAGFFNTALNVGCRAGAGITSYEVCGLFQLDNHGTLADGALNVALYAQARRVAGATGGTWATTFEAIDRYGGGSATNPILAMELDLRANGPDPGTNRGILQLVGTKDDTGGATPTIQFALKIGIESGFGIGAEYEQGIAFIGGPYVVGIDMRAADSYGSAAIWLQDDAPIIWDTAGTSKQFYSSGLSAVVFANGSNVEKQIFFNTGQTSFTNGTATLTFNPLNTGGVVGTSTAHDLVFWANGAEQGRALSAGGMSSASEFFPKASTVADLPACNAGRNGSVRIATDLTAPTFDAVLVGGGAVVRPVVCDGAAWKS